jgi:uncharacterized protein (DUF2236 family)
MPAHAPFLHAGTMVTLEDPGTATAGGRGIVARRRRPLRGLFPGDVYRRVNAERVLLLGGGAALLLQVAHPLVAAGVAAHSDFLRRPLARLYATIATMQQVIHGDDALAAAAAARLRQRHSPVRGEHAGQRFSANDGHLQRWVHMTLVRAALDTYELFVAPLPGPERAAYYAASPRTATRLGIAATVPADEAAFDAAWAAALARDLAVGDAARAVARVVLDPPVPLLPRFARDWLSATTTRLLPPPLRDAYGLRWTAVEERRLARLRAAVDALLPRLPGVLRHFPLARAAARGA